MIEIDEYKKLEETKDKYNEVIEDLDLLIKSLPNKYPNDFETLDKLIKINENKRRIVKEGLKKPYFARIDFKEKDKNFIDNCYIGKVGVFDFDNNIITIDWRAPIASLYYDSNVGQVKYKGPENMIYGEMILKRQYDIQDGKLIAYNDVDTVSNDEILKPYLSVNADSRLKNIVSSIQDEQNKVIRKYIYDNLIVQGVAGSGKTTVALHRIAYLAYNFRNYINSNQYMIIGPNKFFIKYISDVLPDLDVVDVPQLTFDELILEFINEKLKINIKNHNNSEINTNKFKLSLEYKNLLDKYISFQETHNVVPEKDLIIDNYKIMSKNKIKKIYDSVQDEYYDGIENKINKTILLCSTYIKNNKQEIIDKLYKVYINTSMDIANTKKYNLIKKEIEKNNGINYLKKYFTFINKKTSLYYNEFINNLSLYESNEVIVKSIVDEYKENKKGTINYDDIPALGYLHFRIHGSKNYKKFKHTVVDEAQDYGMFHFFVLKQILAQSSFSIFGDLAQSIYDFRSIDNWEEVLNKVFDNNCSIEYLLKSYRTTIEIMEEANKVLKYINLKTALPVIRHGEKVEYIKSNKLIDDLIQQIKLLEEKKYESIALISNNDNMVYTIANKLTKNGLDVTIIDENSFDYTNGICSISSRNSKGLEFDAVIITDASNKSFNCNDSSDMKSLYVAMTRPLHKLIIFYDEKLSVPLDK